MLEGSSVGISKAAVKLPRTSLHYPLETSISSISEGSSGTSTSEERDDGSRFVSSVSPAAPSAKFSFDYLISLLMNQLVFITPRPRHYRAYLPTQFRLLRAIFVLHHPTLRCRH